jgi:hypothetical protein
MRLLDYLPTVFAGHGLDVGGSGGDSGGGGGDGGISTVWIIAVVALGLITIGLLAWLNPSGARTLRSIAPKALIAVLIAAPLVAWTVSSRGGEPNLLVERWIALNGKPELIVSLGKDELNTLATTNGERVVGVRCVDDEGEVVLAGEQKWPFLEEAGYDYPHAHQPGSRDQLQRADSCRLQGTHVRLEADVEGTLTP